MAKLVGPFSRTSILANVDPDTRAGRIMRQTLSALTEDLGGERELTAGQKLLVQAIALKSTRLSLLADRLVGTAESGNDEKAISWLNSMRLDLQALGALKHATPKCIDLHEYIRQKDEEEAEAIAEATSSL